MASKFSMLDRNNVIELYLKGASRTELAVRFGASRGCIKRYLIKCGVKVRTHKESVAMAGPKRWKLNGPVGEEIVNRYLAGESSEYLAHEYAVAPYTLTKYLKEVGIEIRSTSESMFEWINHASPEEFKKRFGVGRKRLNFVVTKEHVAKMRLFRAKRLEEMGSASPYISPDEKIFASILTTIKIPYRQQVACRNYNIDFVCGTIAVEIHTGANNPFTDVRLVKRMKQLLKSNHLLYIWVTPKCPISKPAASYLLRLLQAANGAPTVSRQYWVIRGSGELVTSGCFDGNNGSFIPASV